MSTKIRILLIEDDHQIRRFLRATLLTQGYDLLEAGTGQEGLAMAASHLPEIILLDLGLPDMEGIEVIRSLREWSQVPILIISARGQEREKVTNLDAGADDYLTKPFGVGELLARVRALMRRSPLEGEKAHELRFEWGGIVVDFERHQVFRSSEEIHLTPTEYKLLSVLIQYRGKVVTHRQLLKEVWGPSYVEQVPYLRIFILNLRRKLEEDPARPAFIITEPGVGYRIKE